MDSLLLYTMEQAALEAGRHLIAAAREGKKYIGIHKLDGSLLLPLDLECNEKITAALSKTTIPIVSEETPDTHSIVLSEDPFLTIDPIDGTTACKKFLTERDIPIGFGPLIGYYERRKLIGAVFYHVPNRTLFSAIRDQGMRMVVIESEADDLPPFDERVRVVPPPLKPLEQSVMLFFVGKTGDLDALKRCKISDRVESFYRFGGFANDTTRLALGYEEIQLQLTVNAWDYPATLFLHETGKRVVCDPMDGIVEFDEWKVNKNNPILAAAPEVMEELLGIVRGE